MNPKPKSFRSSFKTPSCSRNLTEHPMELDMLLFFLISVGAETSELVAGDHYGMFCDIPSLRVCLHILTIAYNLHWCLNHLKSAVPSGLVVSMLLLLVAR